MPSLFEQIAQTAHPDNHPQLRAKFEVTWESGTAIAKHRHFMAFGTQTEARQCAKDVDGLYQVVMYVRGKRVVIFEKQY